jgi:hypothetical protein
VHFGGFAPAFTLSLCDSERSRKSPMPIALVVMANSRKRKKTTVKHENRRKFQNFISLTNSGQELKKTFRNN